MAHTPGSDQWLHHRAEELILMEQLKRVELFNGRAAMLGLVIGIVTELADRHNCETRCDRTGLS